MDESATRCASVALGRLGCTTLVQLFFCLPDSGSLVSRKSVRRAAFSSQVRSSPVASGWLRCAAWHRLALPRGVCECLRFFFSVILNALISSNQSYFVDLPVRVVSRSTRVPPGYAFPICPAARFCTPQMAGGMGAVGALPTPTSRITQRTKGGLANGHGSVRALAPGVLRYRVRDASAVAPIGEVQSVRRGRQVEPVIGRVLCVDTPEPIDGEAGAQTAPTTVTILVQPELVGSGAARNPSTGWKPRPPPSENEAHRMTRRRLSEGQEARRVPLSPPLPPQLPQHHVDTRGWEPRDGSAKPIIDAYLAYAPTKGRSALAEVKIMEKREEALRSQTRRRMDGLSASIGRILNAWDELVASGSKQTPSDARVLVDRLEKHNSERSVNVEDISEWYTANQEDASVDSKQDHFVGEIQRSADEQDAEDPVMKEAKAVADEATVEVWREQNRVRKLSELMEDLIAQLAAVKISVRELNSEMKALQTNGLEALQYYQELVKGLKGAIEVADREVKKATDHLREQEREVRSIKQELEELAQTRTNREEWHHSEMERLRNLLERMKQKHLKELQTMEQLHLDRLAQMRHGIQELAETGARTPELDMDAMAQEVELLLVDKGFDVTKADLRKQLQDARDKHSKLESDFMMHSAEEQDLIAERDIAVAKQPKIVATSTTEDPLRAMWRAHKSAFREWQRSCRLAEKRPAIGTQTLEILKAAAPKPLEYMQVPERPVVEEVSEPTPEPAPEPEPESAPTPEPEPLVEPEPPAEPPAEPGPPLVEPTPKPEPEPEPEPELEPEPEPQPQPEESKPSPEWVAEPEPEPGPESKPKQRVPSREVKTRALTRDRKPYVAPKPSTPKTFVRDRIEKEDTHKYQAPATPERALQAPTSVDFTVPVASKEASHQRGPPRRILTSGSAKAKIKTRMPKDDPAKATVANVGFGGIQSAASRGADPLARSDGSRGKHEQRIEPDWDTAWKIIWTAMQINQTPCTFSYIDVDDAFAVEDHKNDGKIGKKALGRGLRRLQIKLQAAELSSVHSAISPTSPTLDYESFARELYMRVKTASGVEREQTELELEKQVRNHPEQRSKQHVPWQRRCVGASIPRVSTSACDNSEHIYAHISDLFCSASYCLRPFRSMSMYNVYCCCRIWKPLRAVLLSQRDLTDYSLDGIHAAFHSTDTRKDGQLGITDVTRAFNQLSMLLTDSQVQILFDIADVGSKGYIYYPDLVAEIYTHIQEIIEQDPVAHQKLRKKKEFEEFRQRAAAKKFAEQQHGLMAQLAEQNRQEEECIKRIQRFLQQTEVNISSLSDDVAKRGGVDAVLGTDNHAERAADTQLESLRTARQDAEEMLAELLKIHEHTAARVAMFQEKTKMAQEALDLATDMAVDHNETRKLAELDGKVAGKPKSKTKRGGTQKQSQGFFQRNDGEAGRRAAVANAAKALFNAVEVDSSGQATTQALIKVLESEQRGEWNKFTGVFVDKLRAAASMGIDLQRWSCKLDGATFMRMVAPLSRSHSWPGALASPSARNFPASHFCHLGSDEYEEEDAPQLLERTITDSTLEHSVTPNRKPRTFKLTVSVNPLVSEPTEIEVQATDIHDLYRKVKKELRLDDLLDIRLSAEGQSTLPEGASPRELRSLSQLPSPARIQVWKRDEFQFEDSIVEMADDELHKPIVNRSQSVPLLGTTGREQNSKDDFTSNDHSEGNRFDDSDEESDGPVDLSELRAAFSAVGAASYRQSVKLDAAERNAAATVHEIVSSLTSESVVSTQEAHATAAKHRSVVFTDPSAALPTATAAALENALRPLTASQHVPSELARKPPQTFSGSLLCRNSVSISQHELARQQGEKLTAVAEALRTPPTAIQGLALSASYFPSEWCGAEVAPTRDLGYVPIRPWALSTPRSQSPARLASLGTETIAGLPVVVHSAAHNGYVLGMPKLGKPGRSLRLRSATVLDSPSSLRSTLPPVWSSGSIATLVPSLPVEPVSRAVMPHAVFLSATPRVRSAGRPVGLAGSDFGRYQNKPNSAPTRGSTANFKFLPRTPLRQKAI